MDKVSNMKDTYGKRTYKCKCGRLSEHYAWESQLTKEKFYCYCNKELGFKDIKTKEAPQTASIRTPTKNR